MIDYIAHWNLNDEKLTWSGTTYFLYQALKKCTDVSRIDVKQESFLDKLRFKLMRTERNFDIGVLNEKSNYLRKKISYQNNIIQIGDLVKVPDTYVYQDLSLGALDYFRNHDPEAFKYSGFQNISKAHFRERMIWQEEFYNLNTHILTMSRWLKDFLEGQGRRDVHYVGSGINVPLTKNKGIPRRNNTALFIGRDFYRKGGDIVVRAFEKMHEDDSSTKLIIAGPKELPDEYKKLPGIEFLGPVDYVQVSDLMKTATLFVMPSRFEAYGLVFLEAMANGLPIIARDSFEMPYFVDEGSGVLIKTGDFEIEQTYRAMKQIFGNSVFLEVAKQQAENIVYNHSWDSVAKKALDIMEKNK